MTLNLILLLAFLLVLILAISKWKVHPFIALILVSMGLGLSSGFGGEKTVSVLMDGFSGTMKGIAIIIILGAFIGEVLQATGGAYRISRSITRGVSDKRLPWAMGFTGYLISIPVFVDVAYILLQPVVESLAAKSRKPVLYIGLALTAGLTVSHTLIPPTPGPLAVASSLGVDIGRMLGVNLIVAAFAMAGGVLWVRFFVKDSWIDYDRKLEKEYLGEESSFSGEETLDRGRFWLDVLPIIVPILLIGLGSFVDLKEGSWASRVLGFVSIPMIAVLIGGLIAGWQWWRRKVQGSINQLVDQAILKSALVIMITGAGGALGAVIKATGVQNDIVGFFSSFPFFGMLLPFAVASMLTTATGSITVSLVSTSSMLGPMVGDLPVSPELAAALIGCGAFCVFHANSSFFWLLNRLHEVPPRVLYKTYTLQSLMMGLAGLAGVVLLKWCGF